MYAVQKIPLVNRQSRTIEARNLQRIKLSLFLSLSFSPNIVNAYFSPIESFIGNDSNNVGDPRLRASTVIK